MGIEAQEAEGSTEVTITAKQRRASSRNGRAQPKAPRVAFYIRISTDEAHQKFSLPAQAERLEAFCKAQHGDEWKLHHVYRDTESGTHLKRPGLQAMLEDAREGKIDALLVFRVDRLSRKVGELARLTDELTKLGVTLTSVTEPFDTSNPAGNAMLQMLGVFAEFEHGTIVERTRVGMAKKAKGGEWCGGRTPYGYRLDDGKLVINMEEAQRIKDIFSLYRRLRSILPTVQEINRRGWKTSTDRRFSRESLRRLLKYPVYAGKVVFGGEVSDGQHQPIIDPETWDSIQRMLETGKGHRQGRNPTALLSGILKCGRCGSSMTLHQSTKGNRRYSYYVCRKAREEGAAACPKSRVAADIVEAQVVNRIRKIARDKKVVQETYRAAVRELKARKPQIEAEIKELEKEKARLERERGNVLDAIASGGLGRDALTQKLGEIDVQIVKVEGKIGQARDEMRGLDDAVVREEDVRKILEGFDELWGALWPEERRRVLGLLVGEAIFDPETNKTSMEVNVMVWSRTPHIPG